MPQPRRLGLIGLTIMGFLLTLPDAVAQIVPCGDPRCPLPPNYEKQLVARYDIDVKALEGLSQVSCSILTPADGGPICIVNVLGPLQPPPNAGGDTPLERARSISRAILEREAALLGIPDPREIRETGTRSAPPGPHEQPGEWFGIAYARFIGDARMAYTHFDFRFRGDATTVYAWYISLAPAPPALYEAAKRKRLPVDEITAIVARDLDRPVGPTPPEQGEPAAGRSERPPSLRLTDAQIQAILERERAATPLPAGRPVIREPMLLAFGNSPFLRWSVYGARPDGQGWYFDIDALTGEIIRKSGPPYWSGVSPRPAATVPPSASPPPAAPPAKSSPPEAPPPGD